MHGKCIQELTDGESESRSNLGIGEARCSFNLRQFLSESEWFYKVQGECARWRPCIAKIDLCFEGEKGGLLLEGKEAWKHTECTNCLLACWTAVALRPYSNRRYQCK